MTIWLILGILTLLGAIAILADMARFKVAKTKAESPMAGKFKDLPDCVLYVQGNKTYWRNQHGTIHKVADYPMDLRPGSHDMAVFTATMDKARKAHDDEVARQKAEAVGNMAMIAKEEAQK
jgi:hypothetical protein